MGLGRLFQKVIAVSTLRIPRCAACGGDLTNTELETVEVRYRKMPGCPRIAWHMSCTSVDAVAGDLFDRDLARTPGDIAVWLQAIHARGPGRLVAGPAWFRGNDV